MGEQAELQRTPLFESHKALGGSMVAFSGWEMPVRYKGDIKEHMAVREAVGVFDISHMGRVAIRGNDKEAFEFVDYITTNDVSKLEDGQGQYNLMCNPDGGIIEDLIVTRLDSDMGVVINAGNKDKDMAWINEQAQAFGIEPIDVSDESALLAVQGPRTVDVMAELTPEPISELKSFRAIETSVAGIETLVSRTGYTGEDGFELWVHNASEATKTWDAILESGEKFGIVACGLGARDSLRLEAGLSLYGHEIDEQTNPYEAGLGWVTKIDKGEFIGRAALSKIKEQGLARKLTGIRMPTKGRSPRQGYPIAHEGQVVGKVASGIYSPYFEVGIGTGYLPIDLAAQEGAEVEVMIKDEPHKAQITKLPFYKRPK